MNLAAIALCVATVEQVRKVVREAVTRDDILAELDAIESALARQFAEEMEK